LAKFFDRPPNDSETIRGIASPLKLRAAAANAVIGILIAIPAIMLRESLHRIAPGVAPFITFFPAVVIAAVLGGRIAGGVVGLAGLAVVEFRWADGHLSPDISTGEALLNSILFLVSIIVILWVTHSLRADRDRADACFEVSGNLLLVIGSDGIVQRINHQGVDVLGYRLGAELIGKDWFETCIPDRLRRQARAVLQEAIADGLLHERESIILRPDGTERTIHWHFVALKRPDGGARGLLASGIDITESRRTLEALTRNEARLNAVLRQFPGAVSILERPHGKIVTRSDRSSEILGHPVLGLDTVEGLARYGGLHEDGRPYDAEEYPIARALKSGEEVNGEMLRYRRGDGAVVDLEIYASPILDERREIVAAVGIALDVTKRVQAEAMLRRREEALRDALAAREMLIREADHRIKNSLQMVISMLSMQKKTIADPGAADSIASTIARVGAIAEAHFALQQSDDLRHVDLGAMLREVSTRLASLREGTAVECVVEGDLMLGADQAIPTALIVSELLTNSLRHAYPPGTPGKIAVTVKNLAGLLSVTVSDDGIGVGDEVQRRVGLGSRLIDMFAAQVGAKTAIHSTRGGGTTVSITMPILKSGEPL
jgi:PAS domain S-box-containing protein